jgi:hypothetical protein
MDEKELPDFLNLAAILQSAHSSRMQITLTQFKNLLYVLKEMGIGLKVKTHRGWSKEFLQIIGFITSTHDQTNKTFGGVVLSNLNETEGILINNISTITAFEVEKDCEEFLGNTEYVLQDNMKTMILE